MAEWMPFVFTLVWTTLLIWVARKLPTPFVPRVTAAHVEIRLFGRIRLRRYPLRRVRNASVTSWKEILASIFDGPGSRWGGGKTPVLIEFIDRGDVLVYPRDPAAFVEAVMSYPLREKTVLSVEWPPHAEPRANT